MVDETGADMLNQFAIMNKLNYNEDTLTPLMKTIPPAQLKEMLTWQFGYAEQIEDFIHAIRGETYEMNNGNSGGRGWKRTFKPLINEDGGKMLRGIMYIHANKAVSLSDFDKEEKNRIVREFCIDLSRKIFVNRLSLGVKIVSDTEQIDALPIEDADLIAHSAEHLYLAIVSGAVNGENRKMIGQTSKRTEVYNPQMQQKAAGLNFNDIGRAVFSGGSN
jgi:hypothetical protein